MLGHQTHEYHEHQIMNIAKKKDLIWYQTHDVTNIV